MPWWDRKKWRGPPEKLPAKVIWKFANGAQLAIGDWEAARDRFGNQARLIINCSHDDVEWGDHDIVKRLPGKCGLGFARGTSNSRNEIRL
jgi:hypothetical protein